MDKARNTSSPSSPWDLFPKSPPKTEDTSGQGQRGQLRSNPGTPTTPVEVSRRFSLQELPPPRYGTKPALEVASGSKKLNSFNFNIDDLIWTMDKGQGQPSPGQGQGHHLQFPVKLEDEEKKITTKLYHHQLSPDQKRNLFDDRDKRAEFPGDVEFGGGVPGEALFQKGPMVFSINGAQPPGLTPDLEVGTSAPGKIVASETAEFLQNFQQALSDEGLNLNSFNFPELANNKNVHLFSPKMANKQSNYVDSSSSEEKSTLPNPEEPGKIKALADADSVENVFQEKSTLGTISTPTKEDCGERGQSHAERLGMLFETGIMGDFYIRLGHLQKDKPSFQTFTVHKAIIFAGSAVFGEMIRRAETDGVDFIVVKDVQVRWEAFRAFLKYFYTGSIDLNEMEIVSHVRNLFEICDLANKFHVMDLKEKCESILELKYMDKNPVEIMHYAIERSSSFLEKTATDYIVRNAVDIFESEEFLKFNIPELCKIFGSDDLAVFSEEQVFTSLLRWGTAHFSQDPVIDPLELKRLSKIIQAPLRLVRFSRMKVQDFVTKVVEKDILSSDEVVRVVKKFAPGNKEPSRDYICRDTILGFNRFVSRRAISVFRPNDVPDVIRFRVSHPIRLLALGVIAESDTGMGTFEITVTVDDDSLKQIGSGKKICRSSPDCHILSLKSPAGIRIKEDVWYTISGYVNQLDDENHRMIFGVDKNTSDIVFDCIKKQRQGERVIQDKLHFAFDENEEYGQNSGDYGVLDEIHFLAR